MALGTDLVSVLHQQSNPEERKTEQQHQRKHDPAAAADLAGCVGWSVGAAVRALVLAGIAHLRSLIESFLLEPAVVLEVNGTNARTLPVGIYITIYLVEFQE